MFDQFSPPWLDHRPPWRSLRSGARFAALFLGLALVLQACSGNGGASGGPRDTIVVVTPDQASNLVRDFGFTAGSDNQEVTNSLHAQLIRKPYVEEEGANVLVQDLYDFEPFLAEDYDVSEDGLTYTFYLREGVLSQQGNELDADDVIWSFKRKFETEGSGMPGFYAPMLYDIDEQIQKIDDYTVSFTVDRAGHGFTLLGNLAENIGSIYDSEYLQEHATPDDPYAVAWGVEDIMRSNVGFGAYMIESFTPDQEIVMVANPNYVEGELDIQRIVRRVVPDAATRANMLVSGDADIAMDLRPADQAGFEDNPDVFTPVASSNLYQSLTLNTQLAPFDQLEVRQALAHAIPYDDIVDDIYQGRAYFYPHLLDDQAPHYDGSMLPEYSYDPERAAQLLEDAGHSDGVSFTLTVPNATPALQDSAVLIAAAAAEAGFDISISEVPSAQVFTEGLEGRLQASMNLGSAVTMSPPYQLTLLTQPGGGSNTSFWSGPSFDDFQAVMDAAQDAGDVLGPEAAAGWSEAEAMFIENAGVIFMARVMAPYSFRSDVEGYAQRTDRRIDYAFISAGQ